MINDPSRRIALLTGANKGIGFEIGRRLAEAAMTLLLGARDPAQGEAAAAGLRNEKLDVRYIHLNLLDQGTIERAATLIEAEFHRLDVLINHAGIADPNDGPPSTADLDAIRRIMDTNLVGNVAVTRAMLPLVRRAPAGRIVNVSSGLGSLTLNGDPDRIYSPVKMIGYCASKAALNMMTVQLAYELRDTAIKVNSADPGFTATDLNQHRGTQTIEEGAAEAVRLALLPADGPTGGFFDSDGPRPLVSSAALRPMTLTRVDDVFRVDYIFCANTSLLHAHRQPF
jgi:NAD(P)-dependent dehydrogenase (short-subunit alcohol dehydrogenase family)